MAHKVCSFAYRDAKYCFCELSIVGAPHANWQAIEWVAAARHCR